MRKFLYFQVIPVSVTLHGRYTYNGLTIDSPSGKNRYGSPY
jgi:hypothetical protein